MQNCAYSSASTNNMTTFTRSIDLYQLYLSRAIALLVGVCAISVFLYVVFLMLAVEHTASRTAAQNNVDDLRTEVSALETQYLRDMEILTPERAAELGFIAPKDVTPVFAQDDGHPLSLQ